MSVYKATMNDIAQAANMSRRTLYMHFKSKEEIYHYVVEDHVKDINEKLQKAADSALPPRPQIKIIYFSAVQCDRQSGPSEQIHPL